MKDRIAIGDAVIFVDSVAQPHSAIVTETWGEKEIVYPKREDGSVDYQGEPLSGHPSYSAIKEDGSNAPCINVAFVTDDPKRRDSYGGQIERATSVCHRRGQTAYGYYWCFPEDYVRQTLVNTPHGTVIAQ